MNRNTKSKPKGATVKVTRETSKGNGRKPNARPTAETSRQGIIKRPTAKKNAGSAIKRSSSDQTFKMTDLQSRQRSSTPMSTPTKLVKAPIKSENNGKDLDALSDISKDSARTSVCSSVSSGLIDLLCHYNAKGENLSTGITSHKDACSLDNTLKNENTFSFVIPTDQPNCDGRIKILSSLMDKLKSTVNSILSSGDSRNVKRLEKLIETMSSELDGLMNELPALWVQKREFEAEVQAIVSPLKAENASLQRKIRILNQSLAEKEKQNETDLNLQLETLDCMNNTLMSQVKKLTSMLQEAQDEKTKSDQTVSNLKAQNRKITEDLLLKNAQFFKSQEIFSNEAGTIKTEVASALQKVDVLKDQLQHAETQNDLMKVSVQAKDEEISRLNDLNKGLQSSVSRLLEDLQKARPRLERSTNRKVSSAILKNIENALNTPQDRHSDQSFFNDTLEYRPNHLTRSYPPPSGKENMSQNTLVGMNSSMQNLYKSPTLDSYNDVLESSRLSSIQTSDYQSSIGESSSTGMRNQAGSIDQTYDRDSKLKQWDQLSICSSAVSFTTTDENDFANGLALLDANIQRLQESLHDMSSKP